MNTSINLRFYKTIFLLLFILFGSVVFGSSQTSKPVEISFQSTNNLIIIPVRVNNSKPLSFILDTGASGSVISESRAKELGLKFEGQTDTTTQGGSIESSSIKGVSFKLAKTEVEFPDLPLTAIPLGGLEAGFGRKIDGILGYEVFERFAVEINYISKTIILHEPRTYPYSGKGEIFPVTFVEDTPFINVKITPSGQRTIPVEASLLVDIGNASTMNLYASFVQKYNLFDSKSKTLKITFGALISGLVGKIGRIGELRFGNFAAKNPFATLPQKTDGDAHNDGLIGGEILRRFRVIIDYFRKQIILEPNKHFSEPYEFDMSGTSLTAGGTDFNIFKVRTIIENSPATDSGLQVGDEITAINKKPTTKMTLDQIRRMFRQAGRKYLLQIKRNESSKQISLTTRKLI